jgi:hypothetical protein
MIMFKFSVAALVAAFLWMPIDAANADIAKPHHPTRLNCGWPRPDPGCRAPSPINGDAPLPAPAPAPAPAPTPTAACSGNIQCLLQNLLAVKTEIVAVAQSVVNDEAGVINTATGESSDPQLVTCVLGSSALGTPGQPGYVAPGQGFIAWVNALPQLAVSAVPEVPTGLDQPTQIAEDLEHARLVAKAVLLDAANLQTTMQQAGFTAGLRKSCQGFVQDAAVDMPMQAANDLAMVALVVGRFIGPAVALHERKLHSKS